MTTRSKELPRLSDVEACQGGGQMMVASRYAECLRRLARQASYLNLQELAKRFGDGLRARLDGVNLDAAVTEKAFQRLSAGHCIADSFRGLGLATDLRPLLFPDVRKVGDNGRRPLLPCGSADVSILSPDLVLDLPQLAHRFHRGCRGLDAATHPSHSLTAPQSPNPSQTSCLRHRFRFVGVWESRESGLLRLGIRSRE